jgi:hypothetical protein
MKALLVDLSLVYVVLNFLVFCLDLSDRCFGYVFIYPFPYITELLEFEF